MIPVGTFVELRTSGAHLTQERKFYVCFLKSIYKHFRVLHQPNGGIKTYYIEGMSDNGRWGGVGSFYAYDLAVIGKRFDAKIKISSEIETLDIYEVKKK